MLRRRAAFLAVALVLAANAVAAPADSTVVYYLHGTIRCDACLRMEAWSEAAVRQEFARELDAGWLVWRALDVHQPENEHFADAFGLTSQALVAVEYAGGEVARWRDLDRVWELVEDRAAFTAYVQDALTEFVFGE